MKPNLMTQFADNLPKIDGYILRREDRNRYGGGVAVYVAESLKHRRRNDLPEMFRNYLS